MKLPYETNRILEEADKKSPNERWWESALSIKQILPHYDYRMVTDTTNMAIFQAKLRYIEKHPESSRLVCFETFECSSCIRPQKEGIGKCLGCKFAGGGEDLQYTQEEYYKDMETKISQIERIEESHIKSEINLKNILSRREVKITNLTLENLYLKKKLEVLAQNLESYEIILDEYGLGNTIKEIYNIESIPQYSIKLKEELSELKQKRIKTVSLSNLGWFLMLVSTLLHIIKLFM